MRRVCHILSLGSLILFPYMPLHADPKLTVLYTFQAGNDGFFPTASLIADAAGNLYGTTEFGGAYGKGTVFKLAPPAQGQTAWTETVLHSFKDTDGAIPSSGLISDSAGNLYGTTQQGGSFTGGALFKLTPPAKGQTVWTETVLHSFGGGKVDGYSHTPAGGLIADAAGNLYGVLVNAGLKAGQNGGVFKLAPPAKGQTAWTETVLHSFGEAGDGNYPYGPLIADSAGNLYGTTNEGGAYGSIYTGFGTVYELSPPAKGQTAWTETVIFSFNNSDGALPEAGLLADSAGNLYGTTMSGGVASSICNQGSNTGLRCGTVFELSPPPNGKTAWTETVLNEFEASSSYAGLIADKAGNLFGTAFSISAYYGYGSVFELSPPAKGKTAWTRNVLVFFNGTNGNLPVGGLIADKAGNFYGTTAGGGVYLSGCGQFGCGTVFELTR